MMSIAQDGAAEEALRAGTGHLTAVADGKVLPTGSRVTIEPGPNDPDFGSDPLYITARKVIGRALAGRGIRVVGAADRTLRLRISLTNFSSPRQNPFPPFPSAEPPLEDPGGTPSVSDQVQVPLGGPAGPGAAQISIALTLFKGGDPPTWTATITATDGADSPKALVGRLTGAAMRAFGGDAERDFVLSCSGGPEAAGGLCLE